VIKLVLPDLGSRFLNWKTDFFQVRKYRFFRSLKRSKLRQRCSDALQKRPLSGSGKSPFQMKNLFISGLEKCFFMSPRHPILRQGCSGALKKRYLSGSENRLLCWKTITFRSLKISFSVHQDARNCVKVVLALWKGVPFPIRKIAFSAEKAFSFTFGKIAFSGRQDARNCIKVVLAPSKSVPFRF